MRPVQLALVGCGRWGRNYIQAVKDSGEAEIAQIVKRGDTLENVDALIYAGHPSGAVRACEAAMMLNKPILCEKPAGLSLFDAERILEAESKDYFGLENRAFVLVGHQHLFAEGFEELRSLGPPISSHAVWGGPDVHDFSHLWDYGPHAVAVTLALGAQAPAWVLLSGPAKTASVQVIFDDMTLTYDAYASIAEPPLTREVRAFARAVRSRGTDDYRFGARWAVDVARILEGTTGTNGVSSR